MDTSYVPTNACQDDDSNSAVQKLAVFAPLVPLAVLIIVWVSGGLGDYGSPAKIAKALGALRDSPLGFGYATLGFTLGSLLFVPITALIAGTMLAFGPWLGFVYAFFGLQLAATATYWVGRALGGRALEYLSGSRIRKFRERLRSNAVSASAASRVLPIGNFTLINWLIGGMKVPFRSFILGNAIGALPGLILFAVFANRIATTLRDPEPEQIALLVGVGVVALAVGYFAQRFVKRSWD